MAIKIPPTDTDYTDDIIKSVKKDTTTYVKRDGRQVKYKNSYEIEFGKGGWRSIKSPRFVPKAGMKVREYGESGWGGRLRGLVIEDRVIFYRSKTEQAQHLIKEQEKRNAEQRTEAFRKLEKTNKIIAGFPPEFKARIERFRQNPNFWWEYEPYEMSCCIDAIKIAKQLKTVEAIDSFYKAGNKEQARLVPGLDKGHSGNSFGMAIALAKCYITKPENVREMHGALAHLVGSKAYAPNKYGV